MKLEKVALIGLGAMGSFFAPRLNSHLGSSFRVIAAGERKDRLEARGVTINGVNHRFTIIAPNDQTGPADLVIIAVKDTGLHQAIADIKNQVGPNTLILSVLNGVDSEEQVAAVYGWEHVLYSYMRISIVMTNGAADFNPDAGKIHFGEAKNDVLSVRVLAVKALFDACGIPYEIDNDMILGMWFKFMCNVGENMTCALWASPSALFKRANTPTSSGAARCGRSSASRISSASAGTGRNRRAGTDHQTLPFPNKASTLQDLENRRPTEVAMFAARW
jgi:2-dehydropantoate 2-reductase